LHNGQLGHNSPSRKDNPGLPDWGHSLKEGEIFTLPILTSKVPLGLTETRFYTLICWASFSTVISILFQRDSQEWKPS